MATLGMDFIIVCETDIAQSYRESKFVVIEMCSGKCYSFVRTSIQTVHQTGPADDSTLEAPTNPEQLGETGQSTARESKGSSTVMQTSPITSPDQSRRPAGRPEQFPGIKHASQQAILGMWRSLTQAVTHLRARRWHFPSTYFGELSKILLADSRREVI